MSKPAAHTRGSDKRGVSTSGETNLATVRVLKVLSEFALGTGALGVTDIAQRLGMSKNMAFRALATLVDQGYLIRTACGRHYELGYCTLDLNNPDAAEPDLRTLAMPTMSRLLEISGETIVLGLRVGNLMVMIDGLEVNAAVRSRAPIGSTYPLHAGPASRVVLAHLGDEEITQYIKEKSPLLALTPNTITDPELLWKEIANVRQQGHALGFGDAGTERRSVAFVILDGERRPWGALSVGGPRERFTQEKLHALLPQLKTCIQELNERTALFIAPAMKSWVY